VGGQLTKRRHRISQEGVRQQNRGTISYRLYVPLGYDANRKYPLLLGLHGATAGAAIT